MFNSDMCIILLFYVLCYVVWWVNEIGTRGSFKQSSVNVLFRDVLAGKYDSYNSIFEGLYMYICLCFI